MFKDTGQGVTNSQSCPSKLRTCENCGHCCRDCKKVITDSLYGTMFLPSDNRNGFYEDLDSLVGQNCSNWRSK